MGILRNTVSICQFRVTGTPSADLVEWVGARLQDQRFRSIEQSAEESALGWVELDDPQQTEFVDARAYRRDHYFAFTLRHDQRKLPAALFKAHREQAEAEFLAAHPELRRVPKQKREDLRDAVRSALLAKSLPSPALHDVVWDTRSQVVTFTALGGKSIELFVDLFNKTFDRFRLVPIHPFARAEQVVAGPQRQALVEANRAASDSVLDQIAANTWLGRDFLFWLFHQTCQGSAEFAASQPGPAVEGEGFVAYLNDRLQLLAAGESGVQKITVSGPQRDFSEVRTALLDGKELAEAVIYLEKGEQLWRLTLKGDRFQFASFRTPPVTLEQDDLTDPAMEREAVFYERLSLLEEGLQLFDSLYAEFLEVRLGGQWPRTEQRIRAALAQERAA